MKRPRQVNARRAPRLKGRFVFGTHPVEEHLRRGAAEVREVWLATPLNRAREEIAQAAEAAGLRLHRVAPEALLDLCGSEHHQGVVASLHEFAYANLEEVAVRRPPLLVAADGVEDPRNLGALVRGIAAAGAGGLLIPRDRAAQVTAVTEKAAAGVTAWFPVLRVVNLARALEQLKKGGYWVAALTQDGERDLYAADLPQPTVLVVGGETGIRPLVRHNCDVSVRIPMAAGVESLNVAVAAAIACFELRRQGNSARR
jgi:23S rRNA (guanosine2251-2'-O)-methyltransferase